MQILIASSVYYTLVVIQRQKLGPIFPRAFLHYKQYFHQNIINNATTTRIKMQQWVSHSALTLTVLVQKIHTLSRCGLVTIQIARLDICSISFWCGFVCNCQGDFFWPAHFCNAVDFTLALLHTNLKLYYLMTYSSDFNNFYWFWLLAVCTIPP